ncbi:transposase [Nonomuraea sp. NPDC050663]|uniref:transposase n=1 Tax=Nonomuraea sp. NPDC050663 TaxID=3364370 RepID=UPI0037A06FD0
MDRRWIGPDGYEVAPATRAGRQVLRIRRHGWLIADCVSVEQVARFVELADLCEVVRLPVGRRYEAAGSSSHHG